MKSMKPCTVRKYFWLILAAGAVIGLLGAQADREALSLAGIFVMFAALIFYVVFYRCPHCGKFLDRSGGEFCPHCGKKINE